MELDRSIITAFLAGEATDAERAALDRWRRASPANEDEFQRRAAIWALIGEAEAVGPPIPREPRADLRGRKVVPLARSGTPAGRTIRPRSTALRVAAVVATAVAAGLLWGRVSGGPAPLVTLATAAEEILTGTLPDGTVVRLGPSSRLTYHGDGGRRDARVEGQVFFAVPPAEHPFRVSGRGGEVTVVGTRFEFVARGDGVRVVVLEGVVALGDDQRKVDIGPSEMGTITEGSEVRVQIVPDVYEATRWMGSFLAFESTPVAEVVRELRSRLGLQVEIVDPTLWSRTLTGSFTNQEPQAVVSNICLAIDARCLDVDGVIRMQAAGAAPPAAIP